MTNKNIKLLFLSNIEACSWQTWQKVLCNKIGNSGRAVSDIAFQIQVPNLKNTLKARLTEKVEI